MWNLSRHRWRDLIAVRVAQIPAGGYLAAELVEEVQQNVDAVRGAFCLFFGPARVQNNREALAAWFQIVWVIEAQKCQVLRGPHLGLSSDERITLRRVLGAHDPQRRINVEHRAP